MIQDLSTLAIRNIADPWEQGIAAGWDVIDGAAASEDLTLDADVIIVGTGAGGGVSAEILSQAGLRVIMVEAARLKSSNQFNMNEGEAYRDLYQEGATRTSKDAAISILQGRAVGGTTVVNWTSSFRTPEQTLNHWQDTFGVTGMSAQDMAPWFERMEKRLKVSRWIMPPNANNDVIRKAAEKLGWHWDTIPRNVDGCWNLGYCGTGCPTNAKMSMLVTTLPEAMKAGATLVHSTEAVSLDHDGTRVTAVQCRMLGEDRQPNGHRCVLRAPTIIVAGGGINTPGLLLRSAVPDPHKRVGKRTTLHVTSSGFGVYDNEVAGYYGAPQSLYSDEFTWRDGATGKMGYKLEVMPVHPGVTSVLLDVSGERLREEMGELPKLSMAIAMMRDGFHEQSPGGDVQLRDDGSPVLDYTLSAHLLEGVRHSLLSQVEMHFAAGAKKARARHSDARYHTSWQEAKTAIEGYRYATHFVPLGSAHVMGGCAMGSDETVCVTDSDGRYRHLKNLYIFDGSVLPTSLGVNPQLTIYSITARNASRLAEKLAPSASATA
ncbi:GMC family oxidoreductase [Alcanivorax sp. JB21]|uniref:GMC family oxidoreductase n=1 Tax=Alcanivorax limicola TaxID=2874102 RepID=UPI001CBDEE38|nr:GMC family oxidoreductase [Alcanivorax limicola]MBZ2189094.1 GMC family oxidoreductase [Alcanivorax limicola]